MQDYQKFLSQFRIKRFQKGELILCQGETPDCAFIVKQGVVKTYNLTLQGEEKPIGFDVEHDIFPVAWVFTKVRYVQYYYEAFTDCEVYCVPIKPYVDYLRKSPDEMMTMLTHLVDKYISIQMRVNALEQSKAPSKVINTIHFLCLRFGVEVKKDTVCIELPLTQQDLANFVGLTRETTGIELKKLQRAGVLTYKKRNYIVRTDKLNDLLDEEYSSGFPLKS
ncbi:MAG TPA: Crp/Fnr family transcriptional regulator [Verrucomicrobiae bacterium]|nr:Crp/Fnr family transcriptional regulator [Verrucomicrobiae bacterium]